MRVAFVFMRTRYPQGNLFELGRYSIT
jgi:hypothetical protein